MAETRGTSRRVWLAALALAALLAGDWLAEARMSLEAGHFAEPVALELAGPAPAAAIAVVRESPNGNRNPLFQLPGRLAWLSATEWFAGLELVLPAEVLAQVQSATVTIGARRFEVPGAELRSWPRGASAGEGEIALQAPASLRAGRSRIAFFDRLRNWPGDAAALAALFDVRAYRAALALLVVLALFAYERSSAERRAFLERGARLGTLAAMLAFVGLILVPVLASRVTLPLSVEQLEGVQATCTWLWARQGAELYARPSLEGCGNIYTPGYYLVSRAWSDLFGLSLPSLRALTWLCIGSAWLAAWRVLARLGERAAAALWLPLYLASFCFLAWLDNANKDPLQIALSMVGLALFARALERGAARGDVWAALAGLAWALAFMTKQSHVAVVAVTLLAALLVAPRRALVAGAAFGAAVLALTALAVVAWANYWDWTVRIPGAHGFSWRQLAGALPGVAGALGGYLALAFLWWRRARSGPQRDLALVCLAFALGGVLMGLLSVGKPRGGSYALLPGVAALCIPVSASFATRVRGRAALAFPLLLLVLAWPLRARVTESDRRAADQLVARAAAEPGEVWIPLEPFANALAGKRVFAPAFCLDEWTAAGRPYPPGVLEAIRAGHFALIVTALNLPTRGGVEDREPYLTIAESYELAEVLPRDAAFAAKDGWINWMRLDWRPRAR